jgi:hypothetical protein
MTNTEAQQAVAAGAQVHGTLRGTGHTGEAAYLIDDRLTIDTGLMLVSIRLDSVSWA